jgi:surface antigen
MILFNVDIPPQPNPLIQTVIVQQVEVPAPVEYTLEEKIKLNVNQCNENTHWIRADNAECLPKLQIVPETPQNLRETIKNESERVYSGSNTYTYGYCTWYVANKRFVPNGLGNANTWASRAPSYGLTVSSTPIVGAIAQTSAGAEGHVAYVEAVNGDSVTISEMNYVGWNKVSTRTVPSSSFRYIY